MLRGPNIFAGYWGLPEATTEAFRGGWFHTGDLGRMDAEGFITLVDRTKDMIISGGENVYPIEVEQVLYRHPAVRGVAVVGVAHAKWGETPVAVVALNDDAQVTEAELICYARERLAHFKCPTPRGVRGGTAPQRHRESFQDDAAPRSRRSRRDRAALRSVPSGAQYVGHRLCRSTIAAS